MKNVYLIVTPLSLECSPCAQDGTAERYLAAAIHQVGLIKEEDVPTLPERLEAMRHALKFSSSEALAVSHLNLYNLLLDLKASSDIDDVTTYNALVASVRALRSKLNQLGVDLAALEASAIIESRK